MKMDEYTKSSSTMSEALEVCLKFFKENKVVLSKNGTLYDLTKPEDFKEIEDILFMDLFEGRKYRMPTCKGQKLGRYCDTLLTKADVHIHDFGTLNEGQRKAIQMKIDVKIKDKNQ